MTAPFAIRRLNAADPDFGRHLDHLLSWESVSDEGVNQRVLEIIVCVLSIIACLMLTWGGILVIEDSIVRGAIDYRVMAIPRWLLYLPLPIGFVLMAIEFGRVLIGRGTLYGTGTEGI